MKNYSQFLAKITLFDTYFYYTGTWSLARTIVVEKDMNSVKVSGLEPNTSYRFRIISQNMFGKSRPSQEIMVKTDGEGIYF